jgi:hypothetical protein
LFDSAGVALEDFSALRCLDRNAEGSPHTIGINLTAAPRFSVDLFGLLAEKRLADSELAA